MKILNLVGQLILVIFLLVNCSFGQICQDCNPPPTYYAPLAPVPSRNRPQRPTNPSTDPNWQKVEPGQPSKPPTTNNPPISNGNCTCDHSQFNSLLVRIESLQQQISNFKCPPAEKTDLGPLQAQINELKQIIEGLKHPLVVNIPPETKELRREIIYLTGLNIESCQKTDIEVAKLRKYDAIQLTTVVIKTKEVSVVKDLPQLIILPEKEQIVGELNVLFYLASLMRTETTPLAPVTN